MRPDFRIWRMIFNVPLISALVAQLSAQLFKVIQPVFRGKAPDLKRFSHYGGMPSAHTAFISGLTVGVALTEGWDSPIFALGAVMTAIVIYDIIKMRKVVEINLHATRQLAEKNQVEIEREIPQFKGHTPLEVAVGIGWGAAWAVIVSLIILPLMNRGG